MLTFDLLYVYLGARYALESQPVTTVRTHRSHTKRRNHPLVIASSAAVSARCRPNVGPEGKLVCSGLEPEPYRSLVVFKNTGLKVCAHESITSRTAPAVIAHWAAAHWHAAAICCCCRCQVLRRLLAADLARAARHRPLLPHCHCSLRRCFSASAFASASASRARAWPSLRSSCGGTAVLGLPVARLVARAMTAAAMASLLYVDRNGPCGPQWLGYFVAREVGAIW